MCKVLPVKLLLFLLVIGPFTVCVSSERKPGSELIIVDDASDIQNSDESTVEEDVEGELEVFIPTHEWQTVKPGQGIPRGLHVRMNLQTGEKEAKLMDEDDPSEFQNRNQHAFDKATVKQLKEALRLIPDDGGDQTPVEEAEKLTKFRSIEEIRDDFEAINMNMITESEVVEELLKKYKEPGTTDTQKTAILTVLEYYLHQHDIAVDFVKMGGLPIICPALNSSDEDFRAAVAFLLGSALQSNPTVQVAAMDSGVMQQLLHVLAIEPHSSVKLKVMYALSSLMRHFPYAQRKFLDLGGLSVLLKFFEKQESDDLKLQLKAITLMYDLVLEDQLTRDHFSNNADNVQKEKLRQYAQVKMKETLQLQGWCQHIPTLLSVPDHDVREKVLLAMSAMADACYEEFLKFGERLIRLKEQYSALIVEENVEAEDENSDSSYFAELSGLVSNLLTELNKRHDEL